MKGEISVKSTLGQGSSFDVNLQLPIVTDLTLHKYDIDSSIKIICMLHNDALAETIISFTESWDLKTHRLHDFEQLQDHLSSIANTDKIILISEHNYLSKLTDEINSEHLNKLNGIIFISSLIDSMSEFDLMVNTTTMVKPVIPSELFNNIIALARSEDAEQQALLTTKQNDLPALNIKLLLVEDDIINLKVAENILEKNGCTIKTVMNGQEALDALKSEHFDLVLMDCHMPVMDGYTATKLIRNGQAGGNNVTIPIIALTANALAGEDKRCIDVGMSDYISKPFETVELINCIQKWSSNTTQK
jgi:CheY-like chemotaxis protein